MFKVFIQIVRFSKPIEKAIFPVAKFSTGVSSFFQRPTMTGYEQNSITPVTLQLDSDELKSIYTQELNDLAKLFKKYNYELRVAGGAVRDLLMGIRPHDLDFATTATPDQMKAMFDTESIRMINAKGEKHGTITPRINDKENFEVTTLRIDVTTDGRHAEVQFTTDWQLDANRRDLTINSLFMDLDGMVYDYFNGIAHIKERKVVFVRNPATRIREDYLRILRYFRFYGRIAQGPNNHQENTLQAIRENVEGLSKISGERIWTELKKILEGNFAGEIIKTMVDVGIAPYIGFPKKPNMEEFDKVWQRLKDRPYHAVTLMAGLLHNVQEACDLNIRLKMSAFERDLLVFLVQHREIPLSIDPLCSADDSLVIRPYQRLILIEKFKITDLKLWVLELLNMQGLHHLTKQMAEWEIPRFPINGNMLRLEGCPGGKIMGRVLHRLKVSWIDSGFKLTAEEMLPNVPEIISEERSSPSSSPPATKRKSKSPT